ncbi:MAG: TRAP transporter TatT component family protein [Spirochaetaceae bacterium]
MVRYGAVVVVFILLAGGCSINRMATRAVTDALSSGGDEADAFSGDDDPELVGDALPFVLKLYDTLLLDDPENEELLLSSAAAYVSYANAFLQTPATMLDQSEYERRERLVARAKKHYTRGRDRALSALDLRYPGFAEDVRREDPVLLSETDEEDVAYLYWAAAGWLGAISADPFDMRLSLQANRAASLIDRAYELEPDFDDGAVHELYLSYYAGMPEGLGGSREKARDHFEKAVDLAEGRKASPYVTLATAVAIPEQDVRLFVDLMERALSVDPDADPRYRLVNTIKQEQARFYLDNLDRFFVTGLDDVEYPDDSPQEDDR